MGVTKTTDSLFIELADAVKDLFRRAPKWTRADGVWFGNFAPFIYGLQHDYAALEAENKRLRSELDVLRGCIGIRNLVAFYNRT